MEYDEKTGWRRERGGVSVKFYPFSPLTLFYRLFMGEILSSGEKTIMQTWKIKEHGQFKGVCERDGEERQRDNTQSC